MKNKGFTLAELLGVIAILAVIAIITMPVIFGVVDNSRKNAFTRSVEEMKNVAVMDYNEYARSGEIIYNYSDNNLICPGCDAGADLELDFTGEIEDGSGTITVKDGEVISLSIENSQFKATDNNGKIETVKK